MKRSDPFFDESDVKKYQEWIVINELSMQTTKPITDKMLETIDHLCSTAKDMKVELNRLKEENKPKEDIDEIGRNIVAIEEALARMRSKPFVSPAAKILNDTADEMRQELECLENANLIDSAMGGGCNIAFYKDEFHEKRKGYILYGKGICQSPVSADLIGKKWREKFHSSYELGDQKDIDDMTIMIGDHLKNSGAEFFKFKKPKVT